MREPFAVFLRFGTAEQELEQAVGVLADGQRLAGRVPVVIQVGVLKLALIRQGLFYAFHRPPDRFVFEDRDRNLVRRLEGRFVCGIFLQSPVVDAPVDACRFRRAGD